MDNLKDYFDRVVVISLRRDPQRLASFRERIAACNWCFADPVVQVAIDGQLCPAAPWWTIGPNAWGAMRSHMNALESALNDGVQRLLVCEDDAAPVEGFTNKAIAFINALPSNSELCYFGGQLNHRKQRVVQINELVRMPESVNRLHAYFFLNRTAMTKAYRHLCRWPAWYRGKKVPNGHGGFEMRGGHHVDHHLERLSSDRQIATYCPTEWLMNQAASYSEIMQCHLPERDFSGNLPPPKVIAVVGPYCGGTSAVAGALHHLGCLMGHKFIDGDVSHTPNGNFEAERLFNICNECYQEPSFQEHANRSRRVELLRQWASGRGNDGAVIGAKHPKLCLMVPEMCEAWPGCKFVVVHRDIAHSIDSLRKRGWWAQTIQPDTLIKRLANTRDRDMQGVPANDQLHIEYNDVVNNREASLRILANFVGIEPTPTQYANALACVDGSLNHHNGQAKSECGCKTPCETCTCQR